MWSVYEESVFEACCQLYLFMVIYMKIRITSRYLFFSMHMILLYDIAPGDVLLLMHSY